MAADVILVDDEPHIRKACSQALALAGLTVDALPSADGAIERIDSLWVGVLVTDIKMSGMDGLALMRKALDIDPELPVLVITGHGDIPMAISAVRNGAYDFIEKPFASDAFVDAVRRALGKRRLIIENRKLRTALHQGGLETTIIGTSPGARTLRSKILNLSAVDADVLIIGETGVGKDLVARTMHRLSSRSSGHFVAINCGAIPEQIIESELFGHEQGAFTGATRRRIGKFEYAQGGTVFLDEIESMPRDLQVRLLRVLQERQIERIGSNESIPVDVRVIAACKRDLHKASADGHFRQDLFFRLNVLSLEVPSLRERMEDVPLLFQWFSCQAAERANRPSPQIDNATLDLLMGYDWPGNVRELQNAAMRFAFGLDLALRGSREQPDGHTLADRMAQIEKQLIHSELKRHDGDLKSTYSALGVSRKTLYDKMRRYGLGRPPQDEE